jgi:hypothetical protein
VAGEVYVSGLSYQAYFRGVLPDLNLEIDFSVSLFHMKQSLQQELYCCHWFQYSDGSSSVGKEEL